MTARAQAMANRVADAILANLAEIGKPGLTQWLTKPLAVQRGIAMDLPNLPKPGLFLLSAGWGPNEPIGRIGGNLTSRTDAKFQILCVSDRAVTSREADQDLNNLGSDVINAIYLDYQLGTLLQSGYLTVTGYQPEVELSGDRWSVASVEVIANWIWDTDNP